MNRKQRVALIFVVLAVLYLGSYFQFRQTHIEVNPLDRLEYVIFPEDREFLYYIFRPLTYIDSMLTDMRFHLGPHR